MVDDPLQMATSVPAFADGRGVTVTKTASVAVQPPNVTVTVYVVVVVGLATGFAMIPELNVNTGLQLYVPPPVAPNVVDAPLHIVTSLPALAVGGGVTVTITASVAVQPPVVTVTVYVVVVVGFAIGLAIVVELNPNAGLQLYVPPPVAAKVVDNPLQMVTSLPALAIGVGFTVTITASVAEQPAAVTVTEYVVVAVGLAIGLAITVELKPKAGLQLYVPPPVATKEVEEPLQIVTSVPALAVGKAFTVIYPVCVKVLFPYALVAKSVTL
jgi:allophanate hydrolase subunit 1